MARSILNSKPSNPVKKQRRRRKLNTAVMTFMADAFNSWILMLILPSLFHTAHFGYLEVWVGMMVFTAAIGVGVHSGFSSFTTAVEDSIKE
jgi:quinol-cytochrome oxidoreductase complex cytochrome b subunit